MPSLALLVALLPLIAGILAIYSNPERATNRFFLVGALITTAASLCIAGAMNASVGQLNTGDAVPWIRANAALGYFHPALLVMTRDSIRMPHASPLLIIKRSMPWLAVAAILAAIACSESFIPKESTHQEPKRGITYFIVTAIFASTYIVFLNQTLRHARRTSGVRRVDLFSLVILNGLGVAIFVCLALLGNLFGLAMLKRLSIFVIPLTFSLSAFAICYYQIFDVSEIAASVLRTLVTTLFCLGLGFVIFAWFHRDNRGAFAGLFVCISLVAILAPALTLLLKSGLKIGGHHVLAQERELILAMTRGTSDSAELVRGFRQLLSSSYSVEHVRVLEARDGIYCDSDLTIRLEALSDIAFSKRGWVTPEAIDRNPVTFSHQEINGFVAQHGIALLIASPQGSRTPALVVALSRRIAQKPFTYTEVKRLHAAVDLMSHLIVRSRLSERTAQEAKMADFAVLSRGLAHDLKNLMTPISAYLVHAEKTVVKGTIESEVHAAARRSAALFTEYIRENLFFAQHLSPKFEAAEVKDIIYGSVHAIEQKAKDKSLHVIIDCPDGLIIEADSALLNRMLANFLSNAIDATWNRKPVYVSAESFAGSTIRFRINDSGVGIAKENINRIFEPYFTTKKFGDGPRGLGLGLAICQKIIELHRGCVSVKSDSGCGTVVTVDIPSQSKSPPSVSLLESGPRFAMCPCA